jgi:hypothetical protein
VGQSALVVVAAQAESVVGSLRLAHDPVAARGVPAHVTILYPFRAVIEEETAREVAEMARQIRPFDARFASIARFPDGVIYLAPQPVDAFRQMIRAAMTTFPDCPPYGGAIADPEPHLTIGDSVDDQTADAIALAVSPCLPISMRVDQLTLLVEDEQGRWNVDRWWPLVGPSPM